MKSRRIPGYRRGYESGLGEVTAALAHHPRPAHYARLELAKVRNKPKLALRDDFGWGYWDGKAVALADYLFMTDDIPSTHLTNRGRCETILMEATTKGTTTS